jgi:hypothetical protein
LHLRFHYCEAELPWSSAVLFRGKIGAKLAESCFD